MASRELGPAIDDAFHERSPNELLRSVTIPPPE
jgi:hypothetical protein